MPKQQSEFPKIFSVDFEALTRSIELILGISLSDNSNNPGEVLEEGTPENILRNLK